MAGGPTSASNSGASSGAIIEPTSPGVEDSGAPARRQLYLQSRRSSGRGANTTNPIIPLPSPIRPHARACACAPEIERAHHTIQIQEDGDNSSVIHGVSNGIANANEIPCDSSRTRAPDHEYDADGESSDPLAIDAMIPVRECANPSSPEPEADSGYEGN